MKKLILSLFVTGALTFGLQSCGEDNPCDDVTCSTGQICDDGNCVTDPNVATCDACGSYDGTADGPMSIEAGGAVIVDTTFSNLPFTASIDQVSGNDVDVTVNITVNGIPLSPKVKGTLNGNTVTVSNETWTYATLQLDVVVDGSMTVVGNDITGNLTLNEAPGSTGVSIDGDLDFTGVRQ